MAAKNKPGLGKRKKAATEESAVDQEQPFLAHLVELRNRLLRSVLVIMVVFMALFPFANELYQQLAAPLLAHLPESGTMIATEVISPFFAPVKLALVTSIFISMPFILYQLWSFIAPGLYRHERRLAFPLLFSSIMLFYIGMAFAYFVVFPLVFGFIASTTPEGVEVMTDITKYLDFVLMIFFAFGIAFEVPIAIILLVLTGITTPDALAAKRPYMIVAAFVLGMLLTPPDVISQVLLALPMWFLFEVGVIVSRMMVKRKKETEVAEDEVSDEEMDAELDKAIAEEDELGKGDEVK